MNKMIPVPILDADTAQRRTFATDFLGLDIEPGDSDDTIMSKILIANGGAELIFVSAEPEPVDQTGAAPPLALGSSLPEPVGRMQGTLGRDDPKVTILINNEERNGVIYDRDVAVGVNGTVWQLRRGVAITIPYRVYEALKIAVRDVITHDPNTHEEHHTAAPALPYSVQALPPQAEVDAWRARTDAAFCP